MAASSNLWKGVDVILHCHFQLVELGLAFHPCQCNGPTWVIAKYGRGTVKTAAKGVRQDWQMRRELYSVGYLNN